MIVVSSVDGTHTLLPRSFQTKMNEIAFESEVVVRVPLSFLGFPMTLFYIVFL
jgi:hypothetical protein